MFKKISLLAKGATVALGLLGFTISLSMPAQASGVRDYSCQQYNSQWQLCTFLEYNPATGEWEPGFEFVPMPGQYATIDP